MDYEFENRMSIAIPSGDHKIEITNGNLFIDGKQCGGIYVGRCVEICIGTAPENLEGRAIVIVGDVRATRMEVKGATQVYGDVAAGTMCASGSVHVAKDFRCDNGEVNCNVLECNGKVVIAGGEVYVAKDWKRGKIFTEEPGAIPKNE